MELRTCTDCGDYAVIITKGGQEKRLLCLDCLEKGGEGFLLERYICSVRECNNSPDYIVSIDDDRWRSFLVCERHFKKAGSRIKGYLSLPGWLTNGDDILLSKDGVTFEMDFSAGKD